jgi:hypothetical protein
MSETDRLVGALWGLFTAEIATGHPVYFCFSQVSVGHALQKAAIATESPLQVICDAARNCFEISGPRAILRPEALTSGDGGRSMAIVLVCQQVLAVEKMVDDGRISRNAYFPRLREMMSSELPKVRQRPLSRSDFLEIWRTFKREVESCKGSTTDTVTFQFGRYIGSNATRGFPFSQALLSRADLIEVQKHSQKKRLLSSRLDDAWRELRRVRRWLSRRGEKLILAGALYEEILDQVRRFVSGHAMTDQSPSVPSQATLLEFGIGVDADDFFSENLFAFVQEKGSSVPMQDEGQVQSKLAELLPANTYIFCPPGESKEYWAFQEREVNVFAGQSFMVVARGHGMQRARAILDGLMPPLQVPETRCCTLGQRTDVRACRVDLPLDGYLSLSFRAGKIVSDSSDVRSVASYEWTGGVCVDLRARKYLREALPDAVRFGAKQFAINDVVGLGDLDTSWEGLKKRIDSLETDATFDLVFPNGGIAQLTIAVASRVAAERVGFLMDDRGSISPGLQRVDEQARALVGYTEPAGIVRPASVPELAALVRDIRDHRTSSCSREQRLVLCARAEASAASLVLKRLIVAFLMSSDCDTRTQ